MWCFTWDESRRWCEAQQVATFDSGSPAIPRQQYFNKAPLSEMMWRSLHSFAGFLVSCLGPFDECILWVTEWGTWPSSENLHLFYRVRETYGERRLLSDAPGHLFLKHEAADLTTFIELALLCGWDFHLLPTPAYAAAFLSHDEFVELHTTDPEAVERMKELVPGKAAMS